MPRSRKKEINIVTTKTGEKITSCYCRKCQSEKSPKDFFNATDTYLDSNGKFSICKDCINEIYDKVYAVENSINKTLYRLCKILNVFYSDSVVDMVISHGNKTASRGLNPSLFGLYISKLMTFGKENGITEFTFSENVNISSCDSDDEIFEEDEELERIRDFWGRSFDADDLQSLESKYAEWSNSHKIETQSERILLKLICLKQLTLEKTITEGKSTGALEKEFQVLLHNAALTPAQATASSSGKGVETWGMFIKTIEENEPAEIFKEKIFDDFDNIGLYIKNYILRPLRNFVLSNHKEFELIEEDTDDEEEYDDTIEETKDDGN